LNGKPRSEVIREYDLTPSAFDKLVKQYQNSGSLHDKDNRSPEKQELIKLRKENQRLLRIKTYSVNRQNLSSEPSKLRYMQNKDRTEEKEMERLQTEDRINHEGTRPDFQVNDRAIQAI